MHQNEHGPANRRSQYCSGRLRRTSETRRALQVETANSTYGQMKIPIQSRNRKGSTGKGRILILNDNRLSTRHLDVLWDFGQSPSLVSVRTPWRHTGHLRVSVPHHQALEQLVLAHLRICTSPGARNLAQRHMYGAVRRGISATVCKETYSSRRTRKHPQERSKSIWRRAQDQG